MIYVFRRDLKRKLDGQAPISRERSFQNLGTTAERALEGEGEEGGGGNREEGAEERVGLSNG